MWFNEWLLSKYGITSDDMTDEDYDLYYEQYEKEVRQYDNQASTTGSGNKRNIL